VFLMIGAFVAKGFVEPFSGQGPIRPISMTGRVIIFIVGLSLFLAALGIISEWPGTQPVQTDQLLGRLPAVRGTSS